MAAWGQRPSLGRLSGRETQKDVSTSITVARTSEAAPVRDERPREGQREQQQRRHAEGEEQEFARGAAGGSVRAGRPANRRTSLNGTRGSRSRRSKCRTMGTRDRQGTEQEGRRQERTFTASARAPRRTRAARRVEGTIRAQQVIVDAGGPEARRHSAGRGRRTRPGSAGAPAPAPPAPCRPTPGPETVPLPRKEGGRVSSAGSRTWKTRISDSAEPQVLQALDDDRGVVAEPKTKHHEPAVLHARGEGGLRGQVTSPPRPGPAARAPGADGRSGHPAAPRRATRSSNSVTATRVPLGVHEVGERGQRERAVLELG